MNAKTINKSVEVFFSSANLEKIDRLCEQLCKDYDNYRQYKANPYEDNEPLSHLECDPWSYVPVLRKREVLPPDEKFFREKLSALFLEEPTVNDLWDSLSVRRRRILKAYAHMVAIKYQEIFGENPDFIPSRFW